VLRNRKRATVLASKAGRQDIQALLTKQGDSGFWRLKGL
jgi:hypothetical protein